MCNRAEEIKTSIVDLASKYAKAFWDGSLTTGLKATLDTERDTLYLERREHKFLGHDGLGCPDT